MDTYADDLAELGQALNLNNAMHIGHSTGGGVVARYVGRHGTNRVAKAVLISAAPPLMLKTAANPGGLPIEVFDGLRAGVQADRAQFFLDLSAPFQGGNRPGSNLSQGLRDSFWLQGDDDQMVPIGAASLLSSKIVKGVILKVIPGAPHGLCSTLKDQVNAELPSFLQHSRQAAA